MAEEGGKRKGEGGGNSAGGKPGLLSRIEWLTANWMEW